MARLRYVKTLEQVKQAQEQNPEFMKSDMRQIRVEYETDPEIYRALVQRPFEPVERPPEDVTAILGEPGHRWLTAQGAWSGDTAMLDVYVSSGGVFDSAEPVVGPPVKDGTMKVKFSGCNEGLISYDIPSVGRSAEVPIQRIVLDNVALCESLRPGEP